MAESKAAPENMAAAGILEVMRAVQKAHKTAESPHLKYKYVAHAELVAEIRTAMNANGLIMVPVDGEQHLEKQEFKTSTGWHGVVGYCFDIIHAESGHTIRIGPVYGEGFDTGDKTIPKANTNAHKYALLLTFMLPSDDDPEADGKTDESVEGAGAEKPAPSGNGPSDKQKAMLWGRFKEVCESQEADHGEHAGLLRRWLEEKFAVADMTQITKGQTSKAIDTLVKETDAVAAWVKENVGVPF